MTGSAPCGTSTLPEGAGSGGSIRESRLELSVLEHSFHYCILSSPRPLEGYVAQLNLNPVTVGDTTVGIGMTEFEMTNGEEAGKVDATANGICGLALEVLNARLQE